MPRQAALRFARALVCERAREAPAQAPCGACRACRRSEPGEPLPLDGSGRKGPLLRHVGDHPDLLWIERGEGDTRVRIGQARALQHALRLRSAEGGRRVAVVADAEWLNQEAQNALLRTLEEPPPATSLLLVTASPAGLLATLRSRCQRVTFAAGPPPDPLGPDAPEAVRELARRLERAHALSLPELLDWAEEYRGPRAVAAEAVQGLLATGSAWLHRRVTRGALAGDAVPAAELRAFETLGRCRRSLVQRNANPQMVAERALLALRAAGGPA
jgi:DNA polymerase III delta prime subunit